MELANFIKTLFSVEDLSHVRLVTTRQKWQKHWKHCYCSTLHPEAAPAYKIVTDTVVTTRLTAANNFSFENIQQQPKNAFGGLPVDFSCVSPRIIFLNYVENKSTNGYTVEPNYVHPTMMEQMEQRKKVLKAMNKQQVTMEVRPYQNCDIREFVLGETSECLYLQKTFVKSFMLLNEKNLWNGIIPLPNNVAQAVGLPNPVPIFSPDKLEIAEPVEFYDLVPGDHVFSWVLKVDQEFLKTKGIFCKHVRVTPKDENETYILYFVVPHHHVQRLHNSCMKDFIQGKIDRRPLSSVGVIVNTNPQGGNSNNEDNINPQDGNINVKPESLSISAKIVYCCHPINIRDDLIIPALDPEFPSYYETTVMKQFEHTYGNNESENTKEKK